MDKNNNFEPCFLVNGGFELTSGCDLRKVWKARKISAANEPESRKPFT
jgi:hypothetical protein